jgi:hypothetical protein
VKWCAQLHNAHRLNAALCEREITSITVGRTSGLGQLKYTDKGREHVSKFIAAVPISADAQVSTRLQIEATMQRDLIAYICGDLRRIGASGGARARRGR